MNTAVFVCVYVYLYVCVCVYTSSLVHIPLTLTISSKTVHRQTSRLLRMHNSLHALWSKTNCGAVTICPPPPTGGDLNSHTELNFQLGGGSPLMSVMRVIILHPLTNSEVRRPSQSKDMADFRSRR